MGEIINLSFKLCLITAIAAISLAFTNAITKDRITEQIAIENELARQQVLSQAETFEPIEQEIILNTGKSLNFENPEIVIEVFRGWKGSEEVGYTFKVLPKGYGGEMTILVGVSKDEKLRGMKVVSHNETPGLGANAAKESFQDQFQNKSIVESLTVVKGTSTQENEVEAITGSTITSQAVTDGVNFAIEIFKELNK